MEYTCALSETERHKVDTHMEKMARNESDYHYFSQPENSNLTFPRESHAVLLILLCSMRN
jgi:hypothetical protein